MADTSGMNVIEREALVIGKAIAAAGWDEKDKDEETHPIGIRQFFRVAGTKLEVAR